MTNIQVPRRQITGIDTEPCGSENWVLLQQFLDSPIIFKRKVSYRLVFRSVVTVADWVRPSVRTYARIISQLNTLRAPEYLLRGNIILDIFSALLRRRRWPLDQFEDCGRFEDDPRICTFFLPCILLHHQVIIWSYRNQIVEMGVPCHCFVPRCLKLVYAFWIEFYSFYE